MVISCSNQDEQSSTSLKVISYLSLFKDTYSTGLIENDSTTVNIAYYQDYILYELAKVEVKLENFEKTIKGDTIELKDKMIPIDTSYTYFIHKKGSKIGLRFDSLKANNGKPFSVDSIVERIGIRSSNLKIFSLDLGKPIKTVINKKTEKIEAEFFVDKKHEDGTADSIYRYYDDKLIKFDFSFSPSLDKEKKSKLCKTHFVDFFPNVKNKDTICRTDYISEIKEINLVNSNQIILLFKRFEKESKNFKLK